MQLLHRDADDLKPSLAIGAIKRSKDRRLLLTRRAPGGEEVNDDELDGWDPCSCARIHRLAVGAAVCKERIGGDGEFAINHGPGRRRVNYVAPVGVDAEWGVRVRWDVCACEREEYGGKECDRADADECSSRERSNHLHVLEPLESRKDARQRWEESGGDRESDRCHEETTNSTSEARSSPQT